MTPAQLYDLYRSQMFDTEAPYLWTDAEVWVYMNEAYREFVRLTGGIPDSTSDITRVAVSVGESSADLSKKILRITDAYRVSDGAPVKVINFPDIANGIDTDYGTLVKASNKPVPGALRRMLIGRQKGLCEWTVVPTAADEVQLTVYRLPLNEIEGDSSTFDDIDDEHHFHLLKWMKSLGYSKDDVETSNPKKAKENEQDFYAYCERVKSEWSRMKHKTRIVQYGGL